jgi:uncharacterized protein (TIGR01777 family)
VRKKILISGATGLVGTALREVLSGAGYDCYSLVRRPARNEFEITWAPDKGEIGALPQDLFGVINLAGENIAGGLWTIARKDRLWRSRLNSTELLIKACRNLPAPPKVFISASGTGFYKDYGTEEVAENGLVGDGFLAHLASAWEGAAQKGEPMMRVVLLRIGMVISKKGGALPKMLTPFKLGVGGILGSGKQYMSWVHLEDLVRIIKFSLESEGLHGPVNAVAPNPVTNYEFTKTLGKVLSRPTIIPAPAFILKTLLGGLAEELLLISNRSIPKKLLESGFKFNFPKIEGAFRAEIF